MRKRIKNAFFSMFIYLFIFIALFDVFDYISLSNKEAKEIAPVCARLSRLGGSWVAVTGARLACKAKGLE